MAIRLTSTSDTPEQIEEALGVESTRGDSLAAGGATVIADKNAKPLESKPAGDKGAASGKSTPTATTKTGAASGPAKPTTNSDDSEEPEADDAEPTAGAADEDESANSSEHDGEQPSAEGEEDEDEQSADDEDETGAAGDETAKPVKGKGGFQKRIDRLTKQLGEERRQREALMQRFLQPTPQPVAQPKAEPPKPETPKLRDMPSLAAGKYETYAEFLEDMTKYSVELAEAGKAEMAGKITEAVAKAKSEWTAEQQTREQQRQAIEFENSRLASVRSDHKDYDAVIEANSHVIIGDTLTNVAQSHPRGKHLLYWCATNPAKLEQLLRLSPQDQIIAVSPLLVPNNPVTAKPAAKPAASNGNGQTVKPRTKTPIKVMKPLGGGSKAGGPTAVDVDNMPYRQYKELRDKGLVK